MKKMLKPDSSMRRAKPGRSRTHPAGNVECTARASGLLDSTRKPESRPGGTVGKRTLESRGGIKG